MMKICSAAVALLLSAYPAIAQYSNPRVSVFGAGSFISADRLFVVLPNGPVQGGGTPIGPFQTDFSKGATVGVHFGLDFTNTWAGEATYSFGGSDLRIKEMFGFVGPGQSPQEREFDAHLHQFLVNGAYYFAPPDEEWRPFATFGIGLNRFSPTGEGKERALTNFLTGSTRISSELKLGINFGGGLEGRITEKIGLQFDLRDHVIGIPRFGLPTEPLNPGGVYYPVTGVMHKWEIAFGAVYYFQ